MEKSLLCKRCSGSCAETCDSTAFGQRSAVGWMPAKIKKVVYWCGTQASVYYAQGVVNRLVNKVSIGTAIPNRCTALRGGMDQYKDGCEEYCGNCIQD